jgi:hypothetical protein
VLIDGGGRKAVPVFFVSKHSILNANISSAVDASGSAGENSKGGADMKLLAALVLLAGASLARATPPDVKELEKSTEIFNRCAKIADEISAMKVPEGHAMHRAQKAANEHPETDVKAKVALDPIHVKFENEIGERIKRLDACGKEYEIGVKSSEELIEKLPDMNITEAEGHSIEDVIKKYHASKDVLTDSVAALSKDIQIQSYVHHTLREHFLKDHHKKG